MSPEQSGNDYRSRIKHLLGLGPGGKLLSKLGTIRSHFAKTSRSGKTHTRMDPIQEAAVTEDTGSNKVWRINGLQLHSFVCGFFSWVTWPERFVDLGWGFLSILLGAACLVSFIQAGKEMRAAYRLQKRIAKQLKTGRQQHSSTLASEDVLKKAGMR